MDAFCTQKEKSTQISTQYEMKLKVKLSEWEEPIRFHFSFYVSNSVSNAVF